jgi:rod shape-determining protein MreD
MMQRSLVLSIGIIGGIAIAQSVILDFIKIAGVGPDLVLLFLVFSAHKQGSINGQITGILGGLVEDFTSLAPLGFHALLRLVLGFVAGATQNKMFLDPIFMPIILVTGATLLKGIVVALIIGVFGVEIGAAALFGRRFFIELGYNAVLAPVVFGILGFVRPLQSARGSRL